MAKPQNTIIVIANLTLRVKNEKYINKVLYWATRF